MIRKGILPGATPASSFGTRTKRRNLIQSGLATHRFAGEAACVVGVRAESTGAEVSVDIVTGEGVIVFANVISETIAGAY